MCWSSCRNKPNEALVCFNARILGVCVWCASRNVLTTDYTLQRFQLAIAWSRHWTLRLNLKIKHETPAFDHSVEKTKTPTIQTQNK